MTPLGALLSPVEAVCRWRQLGLLQPVPQVFGVEADVVAEAVVGDAALAGLGEQPCVWDAEQAAGGPCVDQRREGRMWSGFLPPAGWIAPRAGLAEDELTRRRRRLG